MTARIVYPQKYFCPSAKTVLIPREPKSFLYCHCHYGTCFPLWRNKNQNQVVVKTLPHSVQKYSSRKNIHSRLCSWFMTHGNSRSGRNWHDTYASHSSTSSFNAVVFLPLTEKPLRLCARLCQDVQKGMVGHRWQRQWWGVCVKRLHVGDLWAFCLSGEQHWGLAGVKQLLWYLL